MNNVLFNDNDNSGKETLSRTEILFDSVTTKSDVLNILRSNQSLTRIPLPSPIVSTEQAAKDFKRERVLLNEIPFIPDQDRNSRNNGFILTLTKLVQRLQNQLINKSSLDVADVTSCILQRASRTATGIVRLSFSAVTLCKMTKFYYFDWSGADSYFMVQKLFSVEGTFITQKINKYDPPVRVDVFVNLPVANNNELNVNTLNTSRTREGSISSRTSGLSESDIFGNYLNKSRSMKTSTPPPLKTGRDSNAIVDVAHMCTRIESTNIFSLYDVSIMKRNENRLLITSQIALLSIAFLYLGMSD